MFLVSVNIVHQSTYYNSRSIRRNRFWGHLPSSKTSTSFGDVFWYDKRSIVICSRCGVEYTLQRCISHCKLKIYSNWITSSWIVSKLICDSCNCIQVCRTKFLTASSDFCVPLRVIDFPRGVTGTYSSTLPPNNTTRQFVANNCLSSCCCVWVFSAAKSTNTKTSLSPPFFTSLLFVHRCCY